jgi:NAD(P)-dependent dehydrogenase (short-subunit alcohol dehydrogenase family)
MRFVALNNTVIVTGRSQSKLDAAKEKLSTIHTIQSDVGDPAAIVALCDNVTKRFPALNILINNAGIMRKINLHSSASDLKDLTREIEINLDGPIRDGALRLMGTKRFLKSRDERKRVEMHFAHLKIHHGFERMRLRGLSGARDEFHLAAIVQNLKTLALRSIGPPVTPQFAPAA